MLRELGLSAVEQGLYEALVTRQSATHAEIRALANDHGWGERAPEALARLLDLELVTRLTTTPARYAAAPPRTSLNAMVDARAQDLTRAHQRVTGLSTRFHCRVARPADDPLVAVVRGRPAITRRIGELTAQARTEIAGFETPPYLGDPTNTNVLNSQDHRPELTYRFIYDPRVMNFPARLHSLAVDTPDTNEHLRVGPVPMKLFMFDRRVAVMPLDQTTVRDAMLVVRDPALLALLRTLFDEYWDRAVPLLNEQSPTAPPVELSPANRKLLALLASGYTDRAIAEILGCAQRTVSRRVTTLMRHLGVTTRFQAGYQLVLRGWIGPAAVVDTGAGARRP